MSITRVLAGAAALFLCSAFALQDSAQKPRAQQNVDFDLDVLAILGPKCLNCHSGPNAKGRLDLLSRDNGLRGGRSREATLVPGKPEESRLIAVVDGSDGELLMPPRGDALSASEIEILRQWIADGAPYSKAAESLRGRPWHWAYGAPTQQTPPPTTDRQWAENPIDRFVIAELDREGLVHAPRASAENLARRLSLAITGLLPEPVDAAAFVADTKPDAVERYVDGLLRSPHYGERMARMWLDLARYADTNGYEKDDRRTMWPWRDWVIDAFNENMPFDRFTILQLAGDLVEDASVRTRLATGFHRNTMTNEEGGTDPEEFRVAAVHDRVSTTASVWLGSTLACAQCHDHKFDPFSIEDYYGVFAFFDGDRADTDVVGPSEQRAGGSRVEIPPPEHAEAYGQHRLARDAALGELERRTPELLAAQEIWMRERRIAGALWTTLTPSLARAESGASLTVRDNGVVVVDGAQAPIDTYILEFAVPEFELSALRLEVLPDPQHATPGVGRTSSGNFVLSEIEMELIPDGGQGLARAFSAAFADHEQRNGAEAWPARGAIDGELKSGWAVAPLGSMGHELVLEIGQPIAALPMATLRVTLKQLYGSDHTLARLRLSASAEPDLARLAPLTSEIDALLAKAEPERTPEDREAISAQFAARSGKMRGTRAQLAKATRALAAIPTTSSLVLERAKTPRVTHVHRKGNFLEPGEPVEPALPLVFGALPGGFSRDRLGLARWIASPDNPLFARVFVNHLWELNFGRGLVASVDDFGTQGETPSHRELLDWLALHFASSGFDIKALQRLIVTSQTFLQDSRREAGLAELDPHNRMLARGPRFRMEAEMLRDVALCASGLLDRRIGGPSVFPPQPAGIWTMIYSSDKWVDSVGADRYRRALYTFARRTAPYPTSAIFDAPSRELSCPRRSRTNTPLQSLVSLNDPQFVECAVELARRMLRESGGVESVAIERGYGLCLSRRPSAEEIETLLRLVRDRQAHFAAHPADASALVAHGSQAPGAGEDSVRVATWTVVANVLLNLDEVLTQE